MTNREINLELLLGKKVYSRNNKPVGRIEEIHAEPRDGECFVEEYLIGSYGLFERLAAWTVILPLINLPGIKSGRKYRIGWDKLDLSDPKKPRLRCLASELDRFRI